MHPQNQQVHLRIHQDYARVASHSLPYTIINQSNPQQNYCLPQAQVQRMIFIPQQQPMISANQTKPTIIHQQYPHPQILQPFSKQGGFEQNFQQMNLIYPPNQLNNKQRVQIIPQTHCFPSQTQQTNTKERKVLPRQDHQQVDQLQMTNQIVVPRTESIFGQPITFQKSQIDQQVRKDTQLTNIIGIQPIMPHSMFEYSNIPLSSTSVNQQTCMNNPLNKQNPHEISNNYEINRCIQEIKPHDMSNYEKIMHINESNIKHSPSSLIQSKKEDSAVEKISHLQDQMIIQESSLEQEESRQKIPLKGYETYQNEQKYKEEERDLTNGQQCGNDNEREDQEIERFNLTDQRDIDNDNQTEAPQDIDYERFPTNQQDQIDDDEDYQQDNPRHSTQEQGILLTQSQEEQYQLQNNNEEKRNDQNESNSQQQQFEQHKEKFDQSLYRAQYHQQPTQNFAQLPLILQKHQQPLSYEQIHSENKEIQQSDTNYLNLPTQKDQKYLIQQPHLIPQPTQNSPIKSLDIFKTLSPSFTKEPNTNSPIKHEPNQYVSNFEGYQPISVPATFQPLSMPEKTHFVDNSGSFSPFLSNAGYVNPLAISVFPQPLDSAAQTTYRPVSTANIMLQYTSLNNPQPHINEKATDFHKTPERSKDAISCVFFNQSNKKVPSKIKIKYTPIKELFTQQEMSEFNVVKPKTSDFKRSESTHSPQKKLEQNNEIIPQNSSSKQSLQFLAASIDFLQTLGSHDRETKVAMIYEQN